MDSPTKPAAPALPDRAFLVDLRREIESVRSVVTLVSTAIKSLNIDDSGEMETVLREHANDALYVQIERLDEVIEAMEAQPEETAAAPATEHCPQTARLLDIWTHLDQFHKGKVFGFAMNIATEQHGTETAAERQEAAEVPPAASAMPLEQREKLDDVSDKLVLVSGLLGAVSRAIDEAADSDMDVHDAQLSVRMARRDIDSVLCELGDLLRS